MSAELKELFAQKRMKNIPYRKARLRIPKSTAKDTRWYIEYWPFDIAKGKLVKRAYRKINKISDQEKRKREANHIVKWLNKKLESGYYIDSGQSQNQKIVIYENSIADMIKNWYKYKANILRKRTLEGYIYALKKFTLYLENKKLQHQPINKIAKKHLLNFENELFNTGLSSRSVHNILKSINTFFIDQKSQGHLDINPMANYRYPKFKSQKHYYYTSFQRKELLNYMQEISPGLKTFCLVMYYTWLRTNEIRQLQVRDINFSKKILYLSPDKHKTKTGRHIHISQSLIEILIKHIDKANSTDYLFGYSFTPRLRPIFDSKRIGTYYRHKILTPLGYDKNYSLYSWKSTGYLEAYNAGMSTIARRQHGGWSNDASMKNYEKSLGIIDTSAEIEEKLPDPL